MKRKTKHPPAAPGPYPALVILILLGCSPFLEAKEAADGKGKTRISDYFSQITAASLPPSPFLSHLSRKSAPNRKGSALFSLQENREGELILLFPDRFALTDGDFSITAGSAAAEFDLSRSRLPGTPAAAAPHESGEWQLITRDGTFLRYHPAEGFLQITGLPAAPRDRWMILPNSLAARLRGSRITLWDPLSDPAASDTPPLASASTGAYPAAAAPAPGSRVAVLDYLTMELQFFRTARDSAEGTGAAAASFEGKSLSLAKEKGSPFVPQSLAILPDGRILAGGSSGQRGRLNLYSPAGQLLFSTETILNYPLPPSFLLTASPAGSLFLLDQQNQRLFRFSRQRGAGGPRNGSPPQNSRTPERASGEQEGSSGKQKNSSGEEVAPPPSWQYRFCLAAGETARLSSRHLNRARADKILSWIEGYARRQRARVPLDTGWDKLLDGLLQQKEALRSSLLGREAITLTESPPNAPLPSFRFQLSAPLTPQTLLQAAVATPYGREQLPPAPATELPLPVSRAARRLRPSSLPPAAAVPSRVLLKPRDSSLPPQILTLPGF